MVRLKDIAKQAAVSVMTVSKALRDAPDVSQATKERIRKLAAVMGYVPNSAARGLRTRTTHTFGLIISSTTNPIFARVVLAIEERAHQMGYDLILAHTHNQPDREEQCVYRLLARRVDGFFISPVYRLADEARAYTELAARRTPVVVLGHLAPFCSQFVNVETDDRMGGYAMTRHLLELGHQRIAFVSGPTEAPWSQERLDGYRRALREARLPPDDQLVFQAGRSIEDGMAVAEQMLAERVEATAIQAVNDLTAVGCARALMDRGVRIPEDVSIAGFGNVLVSENFKVPLTTIRQPKFTLGMTAMDMMQSIMAKKSVQPTRLPATVLPRQSTGTAPAKFVLPEIAARSGKDEME